MISYIMIFASRLVQISWFVDALFGTIIARLIKNKLGDEYIIHMWKAIDFINNNLKYKRFLTVKSE